MKNQIKTNYLIVKRFIMFLIFVSLFFIQNIKGDTNNLFYLLIFFYILFNDYFDPRDKKYFNKIIVLTNLLVHYLIIFYRNIEPLFWDQQYFLKTLNCNAGINLDVVLNLTKDKISCSKKLGFGPLVELLNTSYNYWALSKLIFIFTISIVIFLTLKYLDESNTFFFAILISPSFIFLLDSLNPDIYILIFLFIILKLIDKSNNFFYFILILTILSININFKIFPIGVLVGLIIYSLYKNKYFYSLIYVIVFFLNLYSLYIHYIVNKNWLPVPSATSRDFGFLSDYFVLKNINLYQANMNNYLFLLVLFFILLFIFKFKSMVIDITNIDLFLIFFPMVFVIYLFSNHGYKFIFILLFISITMKITNNFLSFFLYLNVFLIPTMQFTSYDFNPTFFNSSIYLLSRLSFYIIFLYLSINFILLLNHLRKKENNKLEILNEE